MATVSATQNGEDVFRQAIGAWESAVDSGVRMQEEYAAWLRQMCCNSESLSEWYHKGQALAGESIVKAQENIDEAVQLMNQQAEASMKLIQKRSTSARTKTRRPTRDCASTIGGIPPWTRCGPTRRRFSRPTATC